MTQAPKRPAASLAEDAAFLRQVVDVSPDAMYVHADGTVLYANAAAAALLGARGPSELVGRHVLEWVHPEDADKVRARIKVAMAEGRLDARVVEHLRALDGRDVHVEIRASIILRGDRRLVLVILRDISERARMQLDLQRRDAILEAVGYAAAHLLRSRRWEEGLDAVLEALGSAADVSRAFVYEFEPLGTESAMRLRSDWFAPAQRSSSPLAIPVDLSLRSAGFGRWPKLLGQGQVVHGSVDRFDEPQRSYLLQRGIRSFMTVPIMVDGALWGTIGFSERRWEREWLPGERDALCTAADTLGAAIQRQRTEAVLRETEGRLIEVLEHSRDVSYRVALSQITFDYVSPAATRVLGFAPEEIYRLGVHGCAARVHPDDLPRYRACTVPLLAGGAEPEARPTVEVRWLHRDSEYRWLSDSRSVVRDGDGRPVALVGSLRDITEQRRTVEALTVSEERFRGIFEESSECIVVFARDLRTLYANSAAVRVAGVSREEYLGRPPAEALAHLPERARVWTERVHRAFASRRREDFAEEYTRDGLTVFAESTILPLHTPAGRVYAVAVIYRDVTPQRLAQRALEESESRYRGLFESIGDAFLLFTADLRVADCNEAAQTLLAISRDELLGAPSEAILSRFCAGSGAVREDLRAALETWCPHRESGVVLCPTQGAGSGGPIYVDLVAYPVAIGGRNHVALLCRDVSHTRRLEEALRQAQQLEALGRLAAGVAHDMGNVLGVVKAECELLDTMLPEGAAERQEVRAIETMVEGGAAVTRRLVAFARGEQVEEEILHVNAIVRRNADVFRRMAGAGVAVTFDLAEEPVYCWGDESQLLRALVNLISNAREAMPAGGSLHICTSLTDLAAAEAGPLGLAPGSYARLDVRDTGCGIPAEQLGRVFEPYFTTKQGRGSPGLGLSVVYGVVAQMGGRALAESREGEGATFTLLFPAVSTEGIEDP